MARTEFIHVLRDWRSLFLAIAIPIVLILLFGYALTLDLKNVPTVIWDQSRTVESRELVSLFDGSPYFSIRGFREGYAPLQREIDAGKAMVALVIPGRFRREDPSQTNRDHPSHRRWQRCHNLTTGGELIPGGSG